MLSIVKSAHLPNIPPIYKVVRHRVTFTAITFNFALVYDIRIIQENQEGLEVNGTHKFLF
jgi:S-ribosylhomocysteine lyase LuxS involved in autoinducer biosynthesis